MRRIMTVCLLVCAAGALLAQGQDMAAIRCIARVRGCAETENGMATRDGRKKTEVFPSLTTTNATIRYFRAIRHACCRKVDVQSDTGDHNIVLTEAWSGPACRCLCFSEIEATLTNVPPGVYTVDVYQAGVEPDGKPMKTTRIVSAVLDVTGK